MAEAQEKVWPMIENGAVQLIIDQTLPMAEAAEAHRRMDAGRHIGKILLVND
ncbi:zinc-binding dehydrogenase [Streptomyces sp. Pv4-95]